MVGPFVLFHLSRFGPLLAEVQLVMSVIDDESMRRSAFERVEIVRVQPLLEDMYLSWRGVSCLTKQNNPKISECSVILTRHLLYMTSSLCFAVQIFPISECLPRPF